MADDVNWLLLLIIAPVLALLTTVPIHPRFMRFNRNAITVTSVAKRSYFNFYAPHGKNRFLYIIFTILHWFTVLIALGLIPIWIFVRLGVNIITSTALRWLIIISFILSLPSPCYLGPSWNQRKQGFEKELSRRLYRRKELPTTKNRYD